MKRCSRLVGRSGTLASGCASTGRRAVCTPGCLKKPTMRPLQRMTWKMEMSLKQQCHLMILHPSLIVEITMLTITCECSSPPMPRVSKSPSPPTILINPLHRCSSAGFAANLHDAPSSHTLQAQIRLPKHKQTRGISVSNLQQYTAAWSYIRPNVRRRKAPRGQRNAIPRHRLPVVEPDLRQLRICRRWRIDIAHFVWLRQRQTVDPRHRYCLHLPGILQ